MTDKHRAAAEALLGAAADIGEYIQNAPENIPPADMYAGLQAAGVSGAMATAHAIVYVGDQFAALVEQHRISNVIAAAQAIASADGAMPHRAYRFLRSVLNEAFAPPVADEEPQR